MNEEEDDRHPLGVVVARESELIPFRDILRGIISRCFPRARRGGERENARESENSRAHTRTLPSPICVFVQLTRAHRY